MSEQRFRDMLGDSAGRARVGAPPYAAITGESRRRPPLVLAGAAVAAAVAATLLVAWALTGVTGGTPPIATAPGSTQIALPTSQWTPGGGGDTARISGRLTLVGRCVVVESGEFTKPVLWPKDWTAFTDAEGTLGPVDAQGRIAAREGDFVEMGGGYRDGARFTDQPCVDAQDDVGLVMSGVTVVEPIALDLPTSVMEPGSPSMAAVST